MHLDYNKYKDDIIRELGEVVKIKSVYDNPTSSAPFGEGTKKCLEYVLNLCDRHGFKTKNLDNYCGYAEIGQGEELFGILVHLDVVPEGDNWSYEPYAATIANNIMYGRGVCDDKGPAVLHIYILKALLDAGFVPSKRIRLIFGLNEESGSRCMEHYLKIDEPITFGYSPDGSFPVINGEKSIVTIKIDGETLPSKDNVILKELNGGNALNSVPHYCKCVLTVKKDIAKVEKKLKTIYESINVKYSIVSNDNELIIEIYGKGAHGSTPQYGLNACSYAIKGLYEYGLRDSFVKMYGRTINTEFNGKSLKCYTKDDYGDLIVNIGKVVYEKNKYYIGINSRLPFNTSGIEVSQKISKTLKSYKANVILASDSKGFIYDIESDLIQAMLSSYQEVTNDIISKPEVIAGGTYARSFNNCVAFGASLPSSPDKNIHGADEHLPLENLEIQFKIFANAIIKLDKLNFKSE